MNNKIRCILVVFFFGNIFSQQENILNIDSTQCQNFLSLIDYKYKNNICFDSIKSEMEIFQFFNCLLTCEGNKKKSKLGNVFSLGNVAAHIPPVTIELGALYLISAKFYEKKDFALAIALRDSLTGKINPDGCIKKTYSSYRAWFNKLKEYGISKARELDFDPLQGTGLNWYGTYNRGHKKE
ncbi:MAG: hypothetical protein GXX85_04695 [Ignavibacteria bacterium]|nr:hypothetical protein [Ignavibacteria bacterium]